MTNINLINERINYKPLEFIKIVFPEKDVNKLKVSDITLKKDKFFFNYTTELGDVVMVEKVYNDNIKTYLKKEYDIIKQEDVFYNSVKSTLEYFGSDNVVFGGSFCMKLLGILNRDTNTIKDLDFILLGDTSKFDLVSSKRGIDSTPINLSDNIFENKEEFESSLHGEFIDTFNIEHSVVKCVRLKDQSLVTIPHDIFIYEDISKLGTDFYMTVKYKDLYVRILNFKTFCITKRVFMATIKNDKSINKHMEDFEYLSDLVVLNKCN